MMDKYTQLKNKAQEVMTRDEFGWMMHYAIIEALTNAQFDDCERLTNLLHQTDNPYFYSMYLKHYADLKSMEDFLVKTISSSS